MRTLRMLSGLIAMFLRRMRPATTELAGEAEPRDLCELCGENKTAESESDDAGFESYCYRCDRTLCWRCTFEGYCTDCYAKSLGRVN